jgi:NCAIR mutase (PurE)-related protein
LTDPVDLLRKYRDGEISEEQVLQELRMDHLENIENRLCFDLSRDLRAGFPEAVLALRKTAADIASIVVSVLARKDRVFVSRIEPEKMSEVERAIREREEPCPGILLDYRETARLLIGRREGATSPRTGCTVGIIAGGTSDIPVAEEAGIICEESGLNTLRAYDVGVAGLHRLFKPLKEMVDADVDVVIVVAGMEGALPSVVKGLINAPVIGVPTSVGYGYRGGESALIAMLNSCVPGILVSNIDNGFGAAAAAFAICSRISKRGRGA